MPGSGERREPSRLRREVFSFVELFAIAGLALAQPVFDIFENGAEIFVLRRTTSFELVLFAAIVLLVPPLALYLLEAGVGLAWRPARRWVHAGFLGGLVGLAAFELVQHVDSPDLALWATVVAGGLAAAAGVVLVLRYDATHLFFRLLAIAPALFGLQFLIASPASDIAFAHSATTAGVEVDDPAPVLILVFDEFPTASLLDEDGAIDARLYPNLARLAGDGTWYRNHAGVSPTTPQAVPAILTGRYPDDLEALPSSSAYPDNLFTLLGGTYELNVWDQVTRLCPDDLCPEPDSAPDSGLVPLLGDTLDVWSDWVRAAPPTERDDAFKVRQSDPSAPDRFERFNDSLDGDGSDPRLDYLHILMPHQPWRYLPDGRRYNAPFLAEGLTQTYSWRSEYFAEAARERHLLQLQLTDRLLGETFDRLDELGRYDDTMIVVTADHGVAFTEGEPIRGLSAGNEAQIMYTPLIVKDPGQTQGRVDDRPVSTIDIVPTIATTLGVELPWPVDGVAVQDDDAPRSDERRYYRWDRFSMLQPDEGEDYVTVDGADAFADLLASGPVLPLTGAPELWTYRVGALGALVGEPVDDLRLGTPEPFTYELDDPGDNLKDPELDYAAVDLDAPTVPAYVSGDLTTRDRVDVVISVNGVIGGWGRSFVDTDDEAGRSSFFAIVPPSLLRDGTNAIEVFTVTTEDGTPVLRPVAAG